MKTLNTLFLDTLADMYDAEQQIIKALPKMSKAAQSEELKEALDSHWVETHGHVQIVEEVFDYFGEAPRGKTCMATAGLLKEIESLVSAFKGSPALDAAIISAAQKVEHYEIASYGCLHTWAGLLGNEDAADLLASVLKEEKLADATLNELGQMQSHDETLDEEEGSGEDEEDEGHETGVATTLRTVTTQRGQR